MSTQTNLAAVAEDLPLVEAAHMLAKGSNYIPGLDAVDDLSDAVSMLPANDDKFSYDSCMTSFKSILGKERKLRSSAVNAA
eukprot:2326675-Ditylum_brightwellii.AAC.1